MSAEEPSSAAAEQLQRSSRIRRLFDVRLVIAGLLALYGVILIIRGATDDHAAVVKAGGVRINLWTGIGMLVVGLLFLLWARLAPLQPPTPEEVDRELAAGADPAADD